MTDTITETATTIERIGIEAWIAHEAQDRAQALAQRAIKKGLTGLRADVTVTNEREEEQKDEAGHKRIVLVADLHIVFSAPVLAGGWSLVGTLDWATVPGTVLLQTVPGEKIPEVFRTGDTSICDHCHTARERNKLIVVKNEAGEYARVGTTCVKDFLGVSVSSLLAWATEISEFEEDEFWGGGHGPTHFSIKEIVTLAFSVEHLFGWVSKGRAYETGQVATAERVLHILTERKEQYLAPDEIAARDNAFIYRPEAIRAITWATTDWTNGNEWGENLRAALQGTVTTGKGAGLICSLVVAWKQHEANELAEKVKREQLSEIPNEFIGKVGDRLTFSGTVIAHRWFDSDYGRKALVTVATEGGVVKTWATGSFGEYAHEHQGEVIKFKATVKKHETYNGRNETTVNRAAVVS